MSQVSRLIAAALALWLAQAGQTPQSQPPPPQSQQPQPPPRFRTETNLVRVDVYATKNGIPIQDLNAQDFEVFEDNTPQRIDSLEHIVVTPAGPAAGLIEPSSPSQANQLAADPRRRVFVVFLDTHNVSYEGSHAIKEPLIHFMQTVMGDDDLVGVMTPDMAPDQITFGRRTRVIEEGLRDHWYWGRRDETLLDAREQLYYECFPPLPSEPPPGLAKAMSMRRRERVVLESLDDLMRYMRAIREGRTAVITVTDGWLLYRPDLSMTNMRKNLDGSNAEPVPGSPTPVGVGRGGTLSKEPGQEPYARPNDRSLCETERMTLAMMDDDQYFKALYGEANRANVSFYTIDPRGLVVFDSPIGPVPPPPLTVDAAMLRRRRDALETLASATDGMALFDSNDLRKQLGRIADDLTSYYLLGYYSTNTKLDGRFRAIKVKSTRPGIEVRSRRGYTAATAEEVAGARGAAAAPAPDAKIAVNKALGAIEPDARAQGRPMTRGGGEPVIFHRGPSTGNQIQPAAGRVFPRSDRIRLELEAAAAAPVWTGALLDRNGNKTAVPVAAGERTDAAGQRWLTADITLAPLGPGDYVVELTATQGTEQRRTLVGIRVTQ